MDQQPGPRHPPKTSRDEQGLTARQRAVLDAVRDLTADQGYPPSLREIGETVGLSSTSSVTHQVNTLQRAGLLRRDPRRPRALTTTSRGEQSEPSRFRCWVRSPPVSPSPPTTRSWTCCSYPPSSWARARPSR